MRDEKDDIEFDELLADKRHKELRSALNIIAQALNKKDDSEVVRAIENQTQSEIRGFAEAIKLLDAPEVKVAMNLNPLEKKAEDILNNQNKLIELISDLIEQGNKLKQWDFEFMRQNGFISSPIKAKQIK